MPPQETSYSTTPKEKKNVLALVFVFAALLVITYMMFEANNNGQPTTNNGQNTKENMIVTKVDLATATGQNKLPAGFPDEIPVETANIVDSYSAVYPDRGVTGRGITEYTVGFTSSKSRGEVYDTYETFMVNSGYRFGEGNRSKEKGILYGRKDTGDLSIFISEKDGKTAVRVTVLKQN